MSLAIHSVEWLGPGPLFKRGCLLVCLFTTPHLLSFLVWWYLTVRASLVLRFSGTAGASSTGLGTQLFRTWPVGMAETTNKILSYAPSQAAPFNLTGFFRTCGSQDPAHLFCCMPDKFSGREWSREDTSSSERAIILLKGRQTSPALDMLEQCNADEIFAKW